MTYQERLCAGLLAMGFQPNANRSGKYIAFTANTKGDYYFVGPAGALRFGRCSSASFSIGDPTRRTAIYERILSFAQAEKPSTGAMFAGF